MANDVIRVRFAPSPTGPLHIGGVRTALFNFLFARSKGGTLILRIDDTDRERSKPEFEDEIIRGLEWLGISWDEGPNIGGSYGPYRQSERIEQHRQAAEKLLTDKKAYLDKEGTVRLRYPAHEVVVNDLVCGECKFPVTALGPEPVLLRQDGTPTYHLASVADDIEMRITHILRGQDHLTNTAKHVFLFRALGSEPPAFAHLPLILDREGGKLSKRNADSLVSLQEFRDAGYLPEAILNFLMLLGWSHPEALEQISLDQAIKSFALERVGKTGAIFDETKLGWLNGRWMRALPAEQIAEQALPFTGEYQDLLEVRGMKFWNAVISQLRDSMTLLSDGQGIAELVLAEEITFNDEAKAFLQGEARQSAENVIANWLSLLKEIPTDPDRDHYTKEQFSQLVSLLKKKTGANGKPLFQSLRLAVMSAPSGPELKVLVPLLRQRLLLIRAESVLERIRR